MSTNEKKRKNCEKMISKNKYGKAFISKDEGAINKEWVSSRVMKVAIG